MVFLLKVFLLNKKLNINKKFASNKIGYVSSEIIAFLKTVVYSK